MASHFHIKFFVNAETKEKLIIEQLKRAMEKGSHMAYSVPTQEKDGSWSCWYEEDARKELDPAIFRPKRIDKSTVKKKTTRKKK